MGQKSPAVRHRLVTHETSVASENYDSDRDRSVTEKTTSYKASSIHTEEEDSYTTEYIRTSAERSFNNSEDLIPESALHTLGTQPVAHTNSGFSKFLWALAMGTVITCSLIFCLLIFRLLTAPKEPISCPQFRELTKHFLHQDMMLWKSLKVGIENVLNENPAKPSVFLLAYTDLDTTQNLMANILNATANCMQTTRPIQLNGATFATAEMIKDYGEIIAKYRDQLKREKILYVSDVNETPAAAAQVFHTICDTVEPLVDKAVIFFTVYLEPDNHEQSPASVLHKVEKVLETNWLNKAVSENTLKALIGRVTDQVFLLRSEKHVTT